MRFVFVPFVVLAASFSLVAAQTATVDPRVKVDPLRPPPPATSVNVLNFPEVQAVEGTVAVSNLPAVQSVAGTVNVGNLPLDADGAVRIASAPAPAREPVLIELVSQPIEVVPAAPPVVVGTVETRGYSAIAIMARNATGGAIYIQTTWRFADDEPFTRALDYRYNSNQPGSGCASGGVGDGIRLVCPVLGSQMQIEVAWLATGTTVTSLRVYLIP